MSRTYDVQSTIDLPRFDARSAAAVATALMTAVAKEIAAAKDNAGKEPKDGKDKKFAANVVNANGRLAKSVGGLTGALMAGLDGEPESELAPALRVETAAWGNTERWLRSFAGLTGKPKGAISEKLLAALYPEGLRFLRAAAPKRWTEAETRLQRIDKEGLAADFHALGGSELLEELRAAHKATGEAAGITVAKAQAAAPALRERLDAVKKDMRNFVLQVVANASDVDTPDAWALAERLLAPLADYTPPEVTRSAPEKSEPGPAPQPEPAPVA